MVGLLHFSNFFIPSEKYYNLQSCWITLYHTEFNLQICNYALNDAFVAKIANVLRPFCPRQKAASFCHPCIRIDFLQKSIIGTPGFWWFRKMWLRSKKERKRFEMWIRRGIGGRFHKGWAGHSDYGLIDRPRENIKYQETNILTSFHTCYFLLEDKIKEL